MVRNTVEEQVKVPAQLSYLKVLRKFVSRIGKKYGFSPSELYAFIAAVDEACANIIEHGYGGHSNDSITLRAIANDERFTIELFDRGKSFDPKQMKRPNLNNYVHIGKKGGLGIFIMRKLLDEIDYITTKDGNTLRLIKFRRPMKQQVITFTFTSFLKRILNTLFFYKASK